MIVHHPSGLHEGVADCGAGEFEAAREEVAAHCVGFGGEAAGAIGGEGGGDFEAAADDAGVGEKARGDARAVVSPLFSRRLLSG